MKNFDFKKAFQIIESKKDLIQEASMGMHEDWFWTGEDVFKDGVYTQDLENDAPEYHLRGSAWATPVLMINYKDGAEECIEVSTGEYELSFGERVEKKIMWTSGCLSSDVQNNVPDIKRAIDEQ